MILSKNILPQRYKYPPPFQPSLKNGRIYTSMESTCSSCRKTFKNAKTLKSHKYKVHTKKNIGDDNGNLVKCPLCPHTVKSKRGMRYHAQSHKLLNHEDESFEGPQDDCSGVQDVPPENAQCSP